MPRFSKSARPKLPGAYTNFEATPQQSVPPSIGTVVAIPFTHDWGPFKQVVAVDSLSEFKGIFGASENTPGFMAVKQAFQGEGVSGRGGAGRILCYRTGGTLAAKATRILQNTTPAAAVTLSAKYEGTLGNAFRVTVQNNASDALKDDLIILNGTVELERFTYADTNITDLVAQINANSDWITATQTITGVALAPVASSPFAAGADGGTLLAGDWTAAMSALEVERFSIFVPYDLTDGAIVASVKAWAQGLNATTKRFMSIIGGALDESITLAVTRAQSLNDPDFITLGVGSVIDDALGVLSTSQLAPRLAGILAARSESMSLTFSRLAGVTIRTGPTVAEQSSAFDAGVMTLGRDSNVAAPVRFGPALTTFTTTTDANRPYLIFREPKFVRTMEVFEMEITEYAEEFVIGQLQVNQKTREAVIAEMQSRLRKREEVGVIQGGWSVGPDFDPPPTSADDFIALLYGIAFGRSVEQVFNTIRIG